ncbi:MAG TPA: phage tail sheath subtilisin-like domain-containing protein, partial [Pyrinomonadaceae bacterium]|nr:phage tail sheath subtilisin-like domain-containing protein [Pyrinomonadaceae bacterium]
GVSAATMIGVDGAQRTGLQVFNTEDLGPGQVAIPGATTQAVHVALLAHAERFKRFALLDLPLGTDRDAAVTARRLLNSAYGAVYWPYVERSDFAGSGAAKLYPPSGFVAGVFARAEAEVGVHQAPAGVRVGRLLNVLNVERAANGSPQTDEGTRALLNQNEVNVIAPLPEQGVVVYGARVLAAAGRVTAVHEQRVLNAVYHQLKKSYREIPFSVVDGEGKLFREVQSISRQYLLTLWRQQALYGADEEEAFVVICDRQNNPPETLAQHQLFVQVGVKISPMAEKVIVNIDSVPLGTSLEVLR